MPLGYAFSNMWMWETSKKSLMFVEIRLHIRIKIRIVLINSVLSGFIFMRGLRYRGFQFTVKPLS